MTSPFQPRVPSVHLPTCAASVRGSVGEKVPLPLRYPQQRTMGSSCTMGIMTTSQLSCTRAMSVLAMTQAATPALLSTGRNSSDCQPSLGGHARMWGSQKQKLGWPRGKAVWSPESSPLGAEAPRHPSFPIPPQLRGSP